MRSAAVASSTSARRRTRPVFAGSAESDTSAAAYASGAMADCSTASNAAAAEAAAFLPLGPCSAPRPWDENHKPPSVTSLDQTEMHRELIQ